MTLTITLALTHSQNSLQQTFKTSSAILPKTDPKSIPNVVQIGTHYDKIVNIRRVVAKRDMSLLTEHEERTKILILA